MALVPKAKGSEDTARAFEDAVLSAAYFHDFGSERHRKLGERMAELAAGGELSFTEKIGEGMAHCVSALDSSTLPLPYTCRYSTSSRLHSSTLVCPVSDQCGCELWNSRASWCDA